MSLPATTTFGELDPLLKFNTPAGLIPLLNSVVQTTITEEVTTYIKSYETPDVDQQDLIWMRLDSEGRPLGTYTFFSGLWVRETPPVSARFGFFTGDPTIYFDGDGKGLPGDGPVALDYWGWQIMNGNNGTPNLSDKFLVMGRMDNVGITGFSGGWRSNILGVPLGEGGSSEFTLEEANIPRSSSGGIQVGLWTTDAGESRETDGQLYGIVHPSDDDFNTTLSAADDGNPAPDPVTHIPPFYAIAMIEWNGYGV